MDIDEHHKEVFAQSGLAFYLAQVFEHGVVNALLFTDLLSRRAGTRVRQEEWEKEFDAYIKDQFEKTLGRLIKVLKGSHSLPEELENLLVRALEQRNFLTHHFFRERAQLFVDWDGREKMMAELKMFQETFQLVDQKLNETIQPLRDSYGFTKERLDADEKAYIKGLGGDSH